MSFSRYVDDVPYENAFIPELAPAWLDFTALLWGFAAPDRAAGFNWCDLGCGQGVTAALLAATHPQGAFVGVDAMATHVDHARTLATAAGATNAAFHAADFGEALKLDLPQFDDICAHGVYSWVDDRARADLLAFIDARLKPGGRVYISYNALPGRAADQPFQQLVRALAEAAEGDSVARVSQAMAFARRLGAAGAAAVTASPMAEAVLRATAGRRGGGRAGARYLAHEYLNPHWRPLSVLEVRRDLAAIGLTPAGSATLVDNFDSYGLPRAARRLLAEIEDADLRDLIRDQLMNTSFRRDVFVRDAAVLGDAAQAGALARTTFALERPPSKVAYWMATAAGEVAFDTPEARAVVKALANGARALADLPGAAAALPSVLALAAAGQIRPVSATPADPAAFNREVAARWGGPDQLRVLALACGAGVQPPSKVMSALSEGAATGAAGAWAKHLAAYGARFGG